MTDKKLERETAAKVNPKDAPPRYPEFVNTDMTPEEELHDPKRAKQGIRGAKTK